MLCPAEKNQDIMTMTRRGNVIYNGCRNHYIRRIRVNAMQSMTPLDPPHYDTISGFSWMAGNLVSASKDRVLKLWEVGKKDKKPTLINQVFNASKDYIKVVRENHDETLMFTADDAGEIKFWELNDLKLECIGGVTPSTVIRYNIGGNSFG